MNDRLLVTTGKVVSWLLLTVWALAVSNCTLVADDDTALADDIKLLAGLRNRKLFELADQHCLSLLDQPDISGRRTTTLLVERIKTLTAWAVVSAAPDRANRWQAIDEIAQNFQRSSADTRNLLVPAQQALSNIAHVRLLRQEIDAQLADDQAPARALTLLRQARTQLEWVIGQIQKSTPTAPVDQTDRQLSNQQLLALKTNMQFQFAICNLERSQLYDADDTANRIDALSQAQQQIQQAGRSTRRGQFFWWQAQLALVKCWRLGSTPQDAQILLNRLPADAAPPDLKTQLLIEKLKVAQATNAVSKVRQQVQSLADQTNRSAELDLAILESAVWMNDRLNSDEKNKWKSFSAALLKAIKSAHGGYWGRRAEVVLLGAIDRGTFNPSTGPAAVNDTDLAILIQIAGQAHSEGRFEQAAKSLTQAIQLAQQLGDQQNVFQLGIQRSQCYEQLGRHRDAGNSLIQATKDQTTAAAASGHLRGCWNIAKSIGQGTAEQQQQSAQQFESQLQHHLQQWPQVATVDTARVWLAQRYQQQNKFQPAIDLLMDVSPASDRFHESIFAAHQSIDRLLQKLGSEQQAIDSTAGRFIDRVKDWLGQNIQTQPLAQLLASDLNVRYRGRLPSDSIRTDIENASWDGFPQGQQWNAIAQSLLIALSYDDPARLQERLKKTQEPDILNRCDRYLVAMVNRDAVASTGRLATVNLDVARQGWQLAQQANDSQSITKWRIRMADLHLALQQNAAAIEVLNDLVQANPRSAELQIKLAEATDRAYRQTEPEKAIGQWRLVAAKLRPQTDRWFYAKYNVAKLLLDNNQRDDAAKLLKFIRANPPGWENSKRKSDFDRLYRQATR